MGPSARELPGDAGARCQRSHSLREPVGKSTVGPEKLSSAFIDSLALCQLAKAPYLKINSSIVVQAIKDPFGTEGR